MSVSVSDFPSPSATNCLVPAAALASFGPKTEPKTSLARCSSARYLTAVTAGFESKTATPFTVPDGTPIYAFYGPPFPPLALGNSNKST